MQLSKHHHYYSIHHNQRKMSKKKNDLKDFQKNQHGSKKVKIHFEHQRIKQKPQQQQNIKASAAIAGMCLNEAFIKWEQILMDLIESADKVIKAIQSYRNPEIDQLLSAYSLKRQNIDPYFHKKNTSLILAANNNSQESKQLKNISAYKIFQDVSTKHLKRLQKIVYHRIIPILHNQLKIENNFNVSEANDEHENSDYRKERILVQKLNCSQGASSEQIQSTLGKFIQRFKEKEQKMLMKINELEQKLSELEKDQEIKEKYQNQQQETLFKTKKPHNTFSLQMEKNESFNKKNARRWKQQISRDQKQIKNLKKIINDMNYEKHQLQQENNCIIIELRQKTNQLNKYTTKFEKILKQNEDLNTRIQGVSNQLSLRGKMIEQSLSIIESLQECLKENQQKICKLKNQGQEYVELITKQSKEKEDFVKHIFQINQRKRQLEEEIRKKQLDIEQAINQLNIRNEQLHNYEKIFESLRKEITDRDEQIKIFTQKIVTLREQLKLKQQIQLKPTDNNDKSAEYINQQYLCDQDQHQQRPNCSNSLRNTSILLTVFRYKELKYKIKQLLQENADLRFQIQKLKTFVGIQKQANKSIQQKEERKYIKSIFNNILKRQQGINNKDLDRKSEGQTDDFIPAHANKTGIEQQQNENMNFQKLSNELQQLNLTVNNDQNSTQQFNKIHNQINKIHSNQQQNEIQMAPWESQPANLQNLLDLNQHIGQNIIKLKQKMAKQAVCKEGLSYIEKEIQYMAQLLKTFIKNKSKKIQKIKKTEVSKKQAEEEIQRLKKRLNEALFAFVNNAQSETILDAKNPKSRENIIQPKHPIKKVLTSVESEVVNINQSFLVSQVRNIRLTDMFRKQSPTNYSSTRAFNTESLLNLDDLGDNTNLSLRDTKNGQQNRINPQKQSPQNLINIEMNQDLEESISLDRLLQEQNQKMKESNNYEQLKVKNIIGYQNHFSFNQIRNAQANSNYQRIMHSETPKSQRKEQDLSQSIKQIPNKPEHQLNIETVQKDISMALKKSNNQQVSIESLLMRQKYQIQRLDTLVKNYKFHQKIQNFKKNYQQKQRYNRQNINQDQLQVKCMQIGNNQALVYQIIPLNVLGNPLAVERQTKSQIKEANFGLQQRMKPFQSIQPKNGSVGKQIITKSQTSRQRQNHLHKRRFDYGWFDLVPEYFGENSQDQK